MTRRRLRNWLLTVFLIAFIISVLAFIMPIISCTAPLNLLAVQTAKSAFSGLDERAAFPGALESEPTQQCPPMLVGRNLYLDGVRHGLQGQNDLALQAFELASTLTAQNSLALFRQAEILARQGLEEEALSLWRRAGAGTYFVTQGKKARQSGDWDAAETALKRGVMINPADPQGYLELATLYRQRKDWDQAILVYREVLALTPRDLDANYHLGLVLREIGDYAQARKQAEQTVTIDPTYTWAYILLGDTYRLEGNYGVAEIWYRKLLDLNVVPSVAYEYLGINRLNDNDPANAIMYLEQALVGRTPDSQAYVHYWLGQAYSRQNDHNKAMEQYRQAVVIQPTNVTYGLALAEAYEKAGRRADAVEQYQQILLIAPDTALAKTNLARLLSER